jgi:GPH family glycoside/pentoside/hexuronide:cation symporter
VRARRLEPGVAARLSLKEKVGYALGDTASNFYWKTFEFFLLIFYTDVFGISPAVAGTMFGVTRFWDALVDPVMGAIADRTRTRFGRFRPYLVWMALPLGAAGVLTFTTPALDTGGKTVYAYLTFSFLMLAYTAINIPYSALMGVMTSDTQERTSLSALRFVGGFSGGIVVVSATPWLVAALGRGDAERGWQLAMIVWGLLAAVLFAVTFVTTRERVEPPAEQRADLRRELADLAANGPWMVMFLLGLLTLTGFIIKGQTTAYFFKYYVGNEALVGVFISSHMIAVIAGIAITGPLTRLFGGKRNLYALLLAVSGVMTMAFFLIPPQATALLIGANVVISFIQGPIAPLVWAMYADTADYGEWKHHRRNTGLVFAAATMAQKGGGALAGLINGFLLTSIGYVANAAQTPEALLGIRAMMTFIPGGLCLVAAAATLLYRLDDKRMKRIEHDLLQRRARAAEDALAGGRG